MLKRYLPLFFINVTKLRRKDLDLLKIQAKTITRYKAIQ